MLNEMSCWVLDWNAIAAVGAWVGGIGSAGAAIAAVWITRRDTAKRRKYAQFLFRRDVERLSELVILLRQSADAIEDLEIHRGEHPDETIVKLARDNGFAALSRLPNELEYFSRSDMLFEYDPATEDFAKLRSAIRYVQDIPDIVHVTTDRFDGVAAAGAMMAVVKLLAEALKPFALNSRVRAHDLPEPS